MNRFYVDLKEKTEGFSIYSLSGTIERKKIIEVFSESPNEFASEVAYLAGDWLLVDHFNKQFFTSPAFTGAYYCPDLMIVSQDVRWILRQRNKHGLELWNPTSLFWSVAFESSIHANSSAINLPMKRIRMLSGMMHSLDFSNASKLRSLLPQADKDSFVKLSDFELAMSNAADDIASLTSEVDVAFSGGKDCTAIALALSRRLGHKNVCLKHVVTFADDTNTDQARKVAEAYNLNLDIVKPRDGWAYGDDPDILEETLSNSLTEVTAPYHAARRSSMALLVDGQSMDGALVANMNKAMQSFDLRALKSMVVEAAKNFPRGFLTNGKSQQNITISSLLACIQRLRGKPIERSGLQGDQLVNQLARLIYKRYPHNVRMRDVQDMLCKDIRTLALLFDEPRPFKNVYYHVHPMQKLVYSLSIFDQPPVHYPYCRAFTDIWSKGISGQDMLNPKWQIQRYIKKVGRVDYNKIKFAGQIEGGGVREIDTSFLLSRFESCLHRGFHVIELSPVAFRDKLYHDFKDLHVRLSSGFFSSAHFQWAYRVLNYELLMQSI